VTFTTPFSLNSGKNLVKLPFLKEPPEYYDSTPLHVVDPLTIGRSALSSNSRSSQRLRTVVLATA